MYVALTLFGTRPEVIKLAPVVRSLARHSTRVRNVVVSSAQHADLLSPLVDQFGLVVAHDLGLARPGQTPQSLLSRCLEAVSSLISREHPDVIIVQGDTTTALAGALAGFYAKVPVAHVEAGLRTGDLGSPFPEEAHRVLISTIASWHFAATVGNVQSLRSQGIAQERIFQVGNPVVDAVQGILRESRPSALVEGLLARTRGQRRIVLTTHRRENFGAIMAGQLLALHRFVERHPDVDLIFPLHPNPGVRDVVARHLPSAPRLHLIEPLDYADFIQLVRRAWLIVSDSGGVQEEAPTLGKPLVVLRDKTERSEAMDCGVARLAGHDPARLEQILESAYTDNEWVLRAGMAVNPFGDGRSGERIASGLVHLLEGAAPRQRRAVPIATADKADKAARWEQVLAVPVAPARPQGLPLAPRRKATLVLPAFNEERDLPPLLSRIRASLDAILDYRVLVVDDGSSDATPDIVTAFSRVMPVTLIRHEQNGGLGAAIRTGLKAAAELEGTVITLDADNSQGPELIPAMIDEIVAGADVVIASRFQPGAAEIGVPRHRVVLSHGASRVLRTFIGYPGVRDYSCGFRAYRSDTLRALILAYGDNFLREHGFSCMVELLINLKRLDASVVEVPLQLRYDLKTGASKMRVFRTLLRYGVVIWRGRLLLPRQDESVADLDLRRNALGQAARKTLMIPVLRSSTKEEGSYGV